MRDRHRGLRVGLLTVWSFQHPAVAEQLSRGNIYRALWRRTPKNWRPSYRWMVDQYAQRIRPFNDAPVWCWVRAHSRRFAPSVETAHMYFGSDDEAERHVLIELAVPAKELLQSSYSRWCDRLGVAQEPGAVAPPKWARMFREPLLAHPADAVQGVLPMIRPSWVLCTQPVRIAGRSLRERLLTAPRTAFA